MQTTNLRPEGAYDHWPPELLAELQQQGISEDVGQRLVFEDGKIKVWYIALQPGERLPFHRHGRNYSWTALSDGAAISHYADGRIDTIHYERGDISYYDHEKKGDLLHDLVNTGPAPLSFCTVEYK